LVIILILLFSFTIRHAREQDMIDQYGQQQTVIAKAAAVSVEDRLLNVQKSLLVLSKLPGVRKMKPLETLENMRVMYDALAGNVRWIARLDEKGLVLSEYPAMPAESMLGKSFPEEEFFRAVEKDRKPFIGSSHPIAATDRAEKVVLMVGVPKFNRANDFSGVIVASMPLSVISDLCNRASREIMTHEFWLMDGKGRFFLHPDGRRIGTVADFQSYPKGKETAETFLDVRRTGEAGTGDFLIPDEQGNRQRAIISYAPISLGRDHWTVAFITPRENVIALFRVTFVDFLLGSLALIAVVIVASGIIARRRIRGMQFREELKRLRERDQWLEMLLHEKKTMEGIVEGTPIPMFVVDKDHKVILWNRACAELTGRDAKEMVGKNRQYLPFYSEERPVIADLILDQDYEGLSRYYGTKMIRASQTIRGAYEARDYYENLGGRKRHLYFLAAPIYDEKGNIIAAIETLQDVSREEAMAKNLQEYAKTLHEELLENIRLRKEIGSLYNYLSSVVKSLPDELYEVGEDGTARRVGEEKLSGHGLYGSGEGVPLAVLFSPEHRDFVLSKWEEAKNGSASPYEIEEKSDDGAKRHLLITTRPIKGSASHLLVVRDVTELKNLEKRYYESQKLAAVGQLSAGIAHEVRNPLSSIKMSLQILEKRMQPQGNDLKRFRIARKEVEHLEQLVKDVLIYAKPSAPYKAPVDVRKIIEGAFAMAEKYLSEHPVRIETNIDAELPPVDVDMEMMKQAFLNIVLNAIDAMAPDGFLKISAFRGTEDRFVTIEFEDNGCGIEEADLPHVFNPFFTKKQYGTGLGLTQVKKIVDMHGGRVRMVGRAGEGCRVIVDLPVVDDQDGAAE
jgi:PAS domain S-box-containing protein